MIPLLEKLYEEIKHGDQEHQDWLRQKMEEYSDKVEKQSKEAYFVTRQQLSREFATELGIKFDAYRSYEELPGTLRDKFFELHTHAEIVADHDPNTIVYTEENVIKIVNFVIGRS